MQVSLTHKSPCCRDRETGHQCKSGDNILQIDLRDDFSDEAEVVQMISVADFIRGKRSLVRGPHLTVPNVLTPKSVEKAGTFPHRQRTVRKDLHDKRLSKGFYNPGIHDLDLQ